MARAAEVSRPEADAFVSDPLTSPIVSMADALVAATAETVRAKVVTLNQKHYPMLADIVVPYRRPQE